MLKLRLRYYLQVSVCQGQSWLTWHVLGLWHFGLYLANHWWQGFQHSLNNAGPVYLWVGQFTMQRIIIFPFILCLFSLCIEVDLDMETILAEEYNICYHESTQVVRDRKWKEIVMVFNYPSTITSASFILRKYYQSLLYHFEQVYYLRKKVLSVPPAGTLDCWSYLYFWFGMQVGLWVKTMYKSNFLCSADSARSFNGSSASKALENGATPHQKSGQTFFPPKLN